jgi:CRP/FNR family transcriptional regulator, anaerobic regulatory protein
MRTSAISRPEQAALAERIARTFPALATGSSSLAERIAADGTYRRVPAGAVMFSQHSPCSGFPLLLSGSVRVVQRYPNGRELQLYRVKAGESCLLSGSCLLSDAEYDATGIAEGDVEVVILPAAAFQRLLADDDAFRRHVFASFGSRLAEVMQMVEAVAYQRLDQRLAKLLLDSSNAEGVVRITHQALADGIGSVREMVSRLLRTFEDRGWVRLGRERVVILDRDALAALSMA